MRTILLLIFMGVMARSTAQIPVELFAGTKRATVDIMFFKYFKNKHAGNTPWLFFNRNRASLDYRMTPTTNLPQFGFTEAISYNPKKFKGLAPLMVVQLLNTAVLPKAGIQFARIRSNTTLFTWLVSETLRKPSIDLFLLFRFTPNLTETTKLFSQLELVNGVPTSSLKSKSFTQRIRLGLQLKQWQFGAGMDFNQSGKNQLTSFTNIGGFMRHEF